MARADILLPGRFAPWQLAIAWQDTPPISACAQARLGHQWSLALDQAKQNNKTLFNGPVTALAAFRLEHFPHLTLARSDYKTFLVTCVRDHDWFSKNDPAAIAPALGNSALLTHRDIAYLGVRSHNVATYANRA